RPRSSRFRVEGPGSYPGRPALAAHIDLDLGPGMGEVGADVGHANADLQRGREGARGDDPHLLAAGEHRVALTGDAVALDPKGRQPLRGALAAGAGDRLGADEPGLLGAAPAEPGLDR